MRYIFVLVVLIGSLKLNAQTYLPGNIGAYSQRQFLPNQMLLNDSMPQKKWSVNRYSGISTSFIFSSTGNATVLSVPLGIQLNRRLSNNLYAFGGLSVAPAYINFNRSFRSANINKARQNNGFMKSNQLNLFSRAEMGLMYINDAKTFSISGSIGIERSNYPVFLSQQINTVKPAVYQP
ncbi:MAG: hypothetical protein ABIN01_05795 [Ferruginibacter sp.]